jgi:hypothetical protein
MSPTDVSDISDDALNLKKMMDGVLDRVITIYQSYNVPLPERRYWTFGDPVVDCEQVVVSFNQMYLGAPGLPVSSPQRCHMPRTATITIGVARSVPISGVNGRPPSPDKIEQSAYISAVDSWVLMQSVNLLDQWDEYGFGLGVIANLYVTEPEGGFQTIRLEVTMAVP